MEKEIFGEGSIKSLESFLKHYSVQRVFLVTGKRSYELSGAKEEIEKLLVGRDHHRHFEFEENPKFSDLLQGSKVVRAYKPDIIVAIGGGSVMDTAKILSVLPTEIPEAKKVIKGEVDFNKKIAPIVAIPTTSGSGSEATHFAVAYLNNLKYSVAGKSLLPDHVILDPELTYSMPPYQTAVSGMDALCQGIESYWAKGATAKSQSYALDAIKLLLPNIEEAVNNPTQTNRGYLAKGANLAGKAINISKTTAPHAFSYYLTKKFNIPHGEAVGMIMGAFLVINYEKIQTEGLNLLHNLFDSDSKFSLYERFKEMRNKIGLDTNVIDLGFDRDKQWDDFMKSVNKERLKNNPSKFEYFFLKTLLKENQ